MYTFKEDIKVGFEGSFSLSLFKSTFKVLLREVLLGKKK